MALFKNSFDSHYEELKTFYPVWYRDVREMDAIWYAIGGMLDEIVAAMLQTLDNSFISRADCERLTQLEQWLQIPPNDERTLAERRHMLRTFFYGSGRIGRAEIIEIMSVFTTGDISVAFIKGYGLMILFDGSRVFDGTFDFNQSEPSSDSPAVIVITVVRDLADRFNLKDSMFVLEKRLPAHLRVIFVDKLNPISFINKSRKVFRSFAVQPFMDTITFNGKRQFDGSFYFDQFSEPREQHRLTATRLTIRTSVQTQSRVGEVTLTANNTDPLDDDIT